MVGSANILPINASAGVAVPKGVPACLFALDAMGCVPGYRGVVS